MTIIELADCYFEVTGDAEKIKDGINSFNKKGYEIYRFHQKVLRNPDDFKNYFGLECTINATVKDMTIDEHLDEINQNLIETSVVNFSPDGSDANDDHYYELGLIKLHADKIRKKNNDNLPQGI